LGTDRKGRPVKKEVNGEERAARAGKKLRSYTREEFI
jgi:hypothetical protein